MKKSNQATYPWFWFRISHERGATKLEYALMASLIAIVAIGGVQYLGEQSRETFEESAWAIHDAVGPGSGHIPVSGGGRGG